MNRHRSRRRSLAAWISSFTFCCCCFTPAPRAPQAPFDAVQQQQPLAALADPKPDVEIKPQADPKPDPSAVGQAKPPAKQPVEEADEPLPTRPEISAEDKELLKRRPIPSFSITLPQPRIVKQVTKDSIGTLQVELIGGIIERTKFKRRAVSGLIDLESPAEQLNIKIRIINDGTVPVKYRPWYSIQEKVQTTCALDESGRAYANWYAGIASWPVSEIVAPIATGKSIVDLVAFEAPSKKAEELTIRLAGENAGRPGKTLTFTIGRKFFETEAVRKMYLDSELARLTAEETGRLNRIEDARIAKVQARIDEEERKWSNEVARIERAKQARIDAANAKAEADRIAAEKEAEAKLPKVSRRNYHKLVDGISLADAQEILGPAKEVARSGGIQIVSWERHELLKSVVITATFQNGTLKSKAIIGD